MFIKYESCSSTADTIITVNGPNSLTIDDEIFEFDESSVVWPNIAEQTNYIILGAYRDEGQLYLRIKRFHTGPCGDWAFAGYSEVNP